MVNKKKSSLSFSLNVFCSASSIMAMGSDVRDILELDDSQNNEFITKDALFGDKKVGKVV